MYEDYLKTAKVLIVDDQVGNICLLQNVLTRLGFTHFHSTSDSRETLRLVGEFEPDIILLDLNMPHLSGGEVLQQLRAALPPEVYLPVLVLTGETSVATKRRALATGATDLLPKPFDSSEVLVRMRNLLKTRYLHLQVQGQNALLEEKVAERTRALEASVEELRQTQRQLRQQERLQAFSEMAGGVVHDFNNALMAVIGYSELLLNGPELLDDRATVTEFLQIMNTSGRDAAQVVSRLRDFYRPRDFSDIFAPVDLNDLLEKIVPMTQPKWRDQALVEGRAIAIELDFEKLPPISASESELRGIATNLIFNAVDAMPQGGTITLRTRRQGGGALVEFTDTGTGMTEEIRSRCLEPFFSTKAEKGTGLGLSMVFGIVKRHNATLELRSEVGVGTTIGILFPPSEAAAAAPEETPAPGRPLQILVVDDEPVTRDVVSRYLQLDGHIVTTARDGPEALAEFALRDFDLLLTDQGMPHMSGLQLAAAARLMCEKLPVILITGFGHATFRREEALVEVDVVLNKPVPQAALRRAVAEALPARCA